VGGCQGRGMVTHDCKKAEQRGHCIALTTDVCWVVVCAFLSFLFSSSSDRAVLLKPWYVDGNSDVRGFAEYNGAPWAGRTGIISLISSSCGLDVGRSPSSF